jgi:TPR repeat protein
MGQSPSQADKNGEKFIEISSEAHYQRLKSLEPLRMSLAHPSLLPISSISIEPSNDYDEEPGLLAVTNQVLAGGSLHSLCYLVNPRRESLTASARRIQSTALSTTTPLIILYGVAAGLRYLHSQGLAHRAVSLGNIVLDDRFEPHLLHYCIRQNTREKVAEYSTYAHQCFFLANEELACRDEDLEPAEAADIYSFGMLFYVFAKQQFPDLPDLPLTEKSVRLKPAFINKFLAAVRAGVRPDVSGLLPDVAAFLGRCWDRNPRKRPAIDEVLQFLEARPAELGFTGIDVEEFAEYKDRVNPPKGGPAKADFLRGLADSCEANFVLGQMYEQGDEVPQDLGQAFKYYHQSARLGSQFGNLKCAMMLHFGVGAARDIRQAIAYYEAAAKLGNADALNNLGALIETGELKRELSSSLGMSAGAYYKQSALLGNPSGCANYARCLRLGLGVQKDPQLAQLFAGGATGDPIQAGVAKFQAREYAEAVRLFQQAADAGDFTGAYNLAWMIDKGLVPADQDASALYRQAAVQGCSEAQNNLGVLLIKQGFEREGYEFIRRAAEGGNAYGMNNLAVALEMGKVHGDIRFLPGLYKQAGDAGLPEAVQNYADAIEQGVGIVSNPRLALRVFKTAVKMSGGKLMESVKAVQRLNK